MDNAQVLELMQHVFAIAIELSAPVLIISMAVGVIISIFQAATQIHEQTITFVPKLIAIALVLLIMGSNMLEMMQDFTKEIFTLMMGV